MRSKNKEIGKIHGVRVTGKKLENDEGIEDWELKNGEREYEQED